MLPNFLNGIFPGAHFDTEAVLQFQQQPERKHGLPRIQRVSTTPRTGDVWRQQSTTSTPLPQLVHGKPSQSCRVGCLQ